MITGSFSFSLLSNTSEEEAEFSDALFGFAFSRVPPL